MILKLDLLDEGRSCCERLSHDCDQHVQQVDHHEEGHHHEEDIEDGFLSSVSIVKETGVHVSKHEVVENEPDGTFPSSVWKSNILIVDIILNLIELKLGTTN